MRYLAIFLLSACVALGQHIGGGIEGPSATAVVGVASNNLTAAFTAADNTLSNNLTAALSGGGGDVYLASNNVFTGENTFSDLNMDSNNIRGINILQFTNGTAGGSQGELIFNNHHETLRFKMDGTQIDIGQHVMWHVEAGENITKGEVVYAGGSTNNHIKAFKYIANGGTPARYIIGVSAEDINTAERGAVTHFGRLDSLSVTNLTVGDILYCSDTVAGGLTNTAPTLEVPIAFAIETNGIAIRVQARDENDFRWTSIDGTGSNNVDKIAINQALYIGGEEITAIQTNLLAADIDDFTNAVEGIALTDDSNYAKLDTLNVFTTDQIVSNENSTTALTVYGWINSYVTNAYGEDLYIGLGRDGLYSQVTVPGQYFASFNPYNASSQAVVSAGSFTSGDLSELGSAGLAIKDGYVTKASIDIQGNVTANSYSGDGSSLTGDKVLEMDDATGTNTEWTEWAIGGTQDQNDNWRIGVIASNLTIQVRVSGAWTNAASFTRP